MLLLPLPVLLLPLTLALPLALSELEDLGAPKLKVAGMLDLMVSAKDTADSSTILVMSSAILGTEEKAEAKPEEDAAGFNVCPGPPRASPPPSCCRRRFSSLEGALWELTLL